MKKSGLKILITTPHFPLPMIGGERIKLFNIISHLSINNKIYLVSLDRGLKIENEYIKILEDMGIETYTFKINNFSATIKSILYSTFRHPLEIEFFNHHEFKLQIDKLVNELQFDLIINLFVRTAEYVKNYNIKKILLAEDCRSYYQKRTAKISNNLIEKIKRKYDSNKLAKYEADIMNYFDITTVVTSEDLEQMKYLNNTAGIKILSQGVDTNYFKPIIKQSDRKGLLFLGKLDTWANILMVEEIINSIFPQIIKYKPDAELTIAGANPSEKIIGYNSKNIHIIENPDNIADLYQNAAIFIHPHNGGSGIQNKVLEAMASGCVVITTVSGANGIKMINKVNGIVAKNNTEIIDSAIELLKDEEQRQVISDNAVKYIHENKSWKSVFNDLDDILEEL
jgi:glycosyltransferase involved in cell wall biosynthesis